MLISDHSEICVECQKWEVSCQKAPQARKSFEVILLLLLSLLLLDFIFAPPLTLLRCK
jgi:hypothetical protein